MMNFWKTFLLWNNLRKEIKRWKKTIRIFSGMAGEPVPKGFDVEENIIAIRRVKMGYQEKAILFENSGHYRIAGKFLELKDNCVWLQETIQSWSENDEEKDLQKVYNKV